MSAPNLLETLEATEKIAEIIIRVLPPDLLRKKIDEHERQQAEATVNAIEDAKFGPEK